ncbi:mucin-like protein [Tasmannia lanceolata]|uniref:mucin-like protein n=1 Tax=Tasmannia lanceolata TaxID=3420 RepID=UPI004063176C
MQNLKRVPLPPLFQLTSKTHLNLTLFRSKSTKPTSTNKGDDEWNDAWETAWLPEDMAAKNRAPWETDVNFSGDKSVILPSEVDSDTKAFVEEMDEKWNERRALKKQIQVGDSVEQVAGGAKKTSVENMKKDYRLKKQRIHAGLWMKEIEKEEEARLGISNVGGGDDIERLLDSCSEIFDSGNNELNDSKVPSTSEFKSKPDGWETTSKSQDGSIWEMSQREEDILLQEFERRIAFSKFQIASFIKSHIFSRRRPIDGWKYLIEELGPNAKRGKGSVLRLPSLSDASTQPFKEEKVSSIGSSFTPRRGR